MHSSNYIRPLKILPLYQASTIIAGISGLFKYRQYMKPLQICTGLPKVFYVRNIALVLGIVQ